MAKKSFRWNFPRPKRWQKKARVSLSANIGAQHAGVAMVTR
jgi:hypothetical protein